MYVIQLILVYLTLALALGYLLKKFVIPKKYLSAKKSGSPSCGQDDCGCH